jgi:asparagine synthase (glutamine-hydrolysing)
MCGIAGFVNIKASRDEQLAWIKGATEALQHRGPDDEGYWLNGPAVLGHRRLSIIDLERGHQPMVDEENNAAVVFNGEIYNFQDLRSRLETKGFQFKTRSDTEVLLKSYLDQGFDCLHSFEGMFAFAIWDSRTCTLFAARDRMGKKPFYYTLRNGVFAFASELSAFQNLPFLKLEVDRMSLARFLSYEYVPTPHTIYKDVFKLRPGHFLTFSRGEVRTIKYWDLPLPNPETNLTEEECCEKVRFLLGRAIKRRLVSDVPLGVFLSGGIDSSSIVALMAEQVPANSIRTFSIGFSEPSYNESPYARFVARILGTDHHQEILSAFQAGDLLPSIVARQDEPMADPSIIPTFLLSQLARSQVTVALSGDEGDELFGGYENFKVFKFADYYLKLPKFLRRSFLEPLLRLFPVSNSYVSPGKWLQQFFAGIECPHWLRTQVWQGAFTSQLQQALWLDKEKVSLEPENIYAETLNLYNNFSANEPLDRIFYLFARQFLLDRVLVKVDRASMMNSLEVRAPFLDKDLIEFAFPLPSRLKIKGVTTKYLLKQAMKDHLPKSIRNRKKKGFMIPTSLYLQKNLRDLVEDMLGETSLKRQGLFRPEVVKRLWAEHDSGKRDYRRELWTLLVLQLWLHSHKASLTGSNNTVTHRSPPGEKCSNLCVANG